MSFIFRVFFLSLFLSSGFKVFAQDGDKTSGPADNVTKSASEYVTPETQKAMDRGLKFLSNRQVSTGRTKGCFGTQGYAASVAISSLAGLAFMCDGSTPEDGRYSKQVDNCVTFVTKSMQPSGYLSATGYGHGNMYGHGFAMLFLSQAYGVTGRKDTGEYLKKAVQLTLSSQNDQGGWRYQPRKSDADLSITVCQIMGLRAAREAGINVPDAARDLCMQYVRKSRTAEGSYTYTLGSGHSTVALTAAGVVSLYSAGIYDGEEIVTGLKYIKNNSKNIRSHYYFYTNYYASQAMWHAGGEFWDWYYPMVREDLLKNQQGDGSWTSGYGPEFGTSMALIILQMPKDQVPVFAR